MATNDTTIYENGTCWPYRHTYELFVVTKRGSEWVTTVVHHEHQSGKTSAAIAEVKKRMYTFGNFPQGCIKIVRLRK